MALRRPNTRSSLILLMAVLAYRGFGPPTRLQDVGLQPYPLTGIEYQPSEQGVCV